MFEPKQTQTNAASEAQVKAATQKDKREYRQKIDDMRFVLGDARGRRMVYRYLERSGVFRTSFTGNSETFFREGERNIGLQLLNDIHEADPAAYLKMIEEKKQRDLQQGEPINDRDSNE